VRTAQWFKDDEVLLLRGRMIANIDVVYRQQVEAALNGLADDAVVLYETRSLITNITSAVLQTTHGLLNDCHLLPRSIGRSTLLTKGSSNH